jgi:hypothetical protein
MAISCHWRFIWLNFQILGLFRLMVVLCGQEQTSEDIASCHTLHQAADAVAARQTKIGQEDR